MTPEQKKEGLVHVRYEMRRLRECYDRWNALHDGVYTQSEMNDLIELTLLHSRTILDFFECSRGHSEIRKRNAHKEDIVSEDYNWPAKAITIDKKIKKRINTEIAHLSYIRCGLTREQKRWSPELFVPLLLKQSVAFLAHIDAKKA